MPKQPSVTASELDQTTTTGRGTTRRALLKGAAWSVPVIALAATAPLASASPLNCSAILDWGNLAGAISRQPANPGLRENFQNLLAFTTAVGTVGLTIQHEWVGSAQNDSSNQNGTRNGSITGDSVGGLGTRGYELRQQIGENGRGEPTTGKYQRVTFTFDQVVTDLAFAICDFDKKWSQGNYEQWDGAYISNTTASFQSVKPTGSLVSGSGTSSNPWRLGTTADQDFNRNDVEARIDVQFSGPLTSFALNYVNFGYSTGNDTSSGTTNSQSLFISTLRGRVTGTC